MNVPRDSIATKQNVKRCRAIQSSKASQVLLPVILKISSRQSPITTVVAIPSDTGPVSNRAIR
nr:MAG TPA: hypothetical protein [Caudoviricetes sp.]